MSIQSGDDNGHQQRSIELHWVILALGLVLVVAGQFKATNCQLPHFANEFFGSIVYCKVNPYGLSYEESNYMWSTIGD
jgi:hypothetical protein